MRIKVTKIGDGVGIVLPKELLARMRLGEGDELYATELPDGVKLTRLDPKVAKQLEVAERVMEKNRDLLRKLADS